MFCLAILILMIMLAFILIELNRHKRSYIVLDGSAHARTSVFAKITCFVLFLKLVLGLKSVSLINKL